MKKSFILIIGLLLAASTSFAQPGYRGKKNWIECDLLAFSAVLQPTYNKGNGGNGADNPVSSMVYNYLRFNTTLSFSYNRVIDRKQALGLQLNIDRTSFGYTPQLNGADIPLYDDDLPETKLFSRTIGISYFKFSKTKGNIAPQGWYTEWEMLYGKSIMYDEKFDQKLGDFGLGYIGIGFGIKKIYLNRFLLNIGGKFRISNYIFNIIKDTDNMSNEELLFHNAKGRQTAKQFFNATFGLGYIF